MVDLSFLQFSVVFVMLWILVRVLKKLFVAFPWVVTRTGPDKISDFSQKAEK